MKTHTLVFTLTLLLSGVALAAPPPDALLTARTKLALLTTEGVSSGAIHVDSADGVVMLYGKVDTAGQRAKAEATARAVGGVRDVTNQLQVVPVGQAKEIARTDAETNTAVQKALTGDPALSDSSIRVKSVAKGVVMLTGKADSFSDHLRAMRLTSRTAGVRQVTSEVVSPDAFGKREQVSMLTEAGKAPRSSARDMQTTASVKLRLFAAKEVPSTEIGVDTEDGVVSLFGIVPTSAVRDAAGIEASRANGVVRVDNLLEVVSSAQKAAVVAKDEDIARDVSLAVKDRPEFKRVVAKLKNGVIQLTGAVETGWDELAMARLARRIPGVRGIENQLQVDVLR